MKMENKHGSTRIEETIFGCYPEFDWDLRALPIFLDIIDKVIEKFYYLETFSDFQNEYLMG